MMSRFVAAALPALIPWAAAAATPPPLAVTIKPIVGGEGAVTHIEVSERVDGATVDGNPLSFRAALSAITVAHIADSIADLTISDATGPVPFETVDDASPSDFFAYRHWRLVRRVSTPLIVHYRIPVQTGPLRGGPPFGMAPAGHGVAGSGYAFLMLPENLQADQTRIRWDLAMMEPSAIGTFTSGEGDAIITGPPQQIAGQWVLAGPARTSSPARATGFHSYILGEPPFDRDALAVYGRRAYDVLTTHLTWFGRPNYRLMVRVRDGKSFTTGTAGLDHAAGALVTTGTEFYDGQNYDEVRNTVFHEMTHYWVGELEDGGNWFSEGLTVFLTATLPCRDRLSAPAECAADLNDFLRNYYTSPGRNWSQAKIEASGFSAEDVRRVPYARGALYFADLNSHILARSHGRRTLIDALRPLMLARARGVPFTVARFETMVARELGDGAAAAFRAEIIDGTAAIEPPANAFRPCLVRQSVTFTDARGFTTRGLAWKPVGGHPSATCLPR